MLEIIALYFIFKETGRLAREKGYSAIRWRVHAFLAWFFGELIGIAVMMTYFPGQFYAMLIMGICTAYFSYLILKKYWASLPYNPEDHG